MRGGGGGHAQIPGMKVKPAGRTTPADVFSTVPLVEDEDCCHVGLLVWTGMETVDKDEEEVEEMVWVCLATSCRGNQKLKHWSRSDLRPLTTTLRYLGDLSTAIALSHLVGKISFLETSGAHPLVSGRVRAWGWVWWVEAGLNEGFSCLWRDHWLKLSGGKCVYMTSFTGHQQQHLSTSQCWQLIGLQKKERST